MNPDLRESLDKLAGWHERQARDYASDHGGSSVVLREHGALHATAAADIRAAIVSADDATKNLLTFRHHLAERRKYEAEPEAITGFDQLEGKS
jgi:glycine/D-amino acid oxidase-like deaminating enzyme